MIFNMMVPVDVLQCVQLVLLEFTVKWILMTVLEHRAITTVLVLILSITTAVVVDQDGLVDCVMPFWGLYAIKLLTITLMSVWMEVFVMILMTRITTHVLVFLVTLVGTVNLNLTLVIALHVNKVVHVLSSQVMTSNVTVPQVSSLHWNPVNMVTVDHNFMLF